MRVGIVNDLKLALESLRRVVAGASGYEVAWLAENGEQAVDQCARDLPDMVLMDLIMPVMDGVEATRRIMQKTPCPILVVTATVEGNAGKVFEAMGYGALDAVCTPALGPGGKMEGAHALLEKMATIGRLISKPATASTTVLRGAAGRRAAGLFPLVAIGASTGGPMALADTLEGIPADAGCSVVIVQHVDAQFAPGLAEWLQQQCAMPVKLIVPGERPQAGAIHLAASNDHLILDAAGVFQYTPEPTAVAYRPSVDVFFLTLAHHWPTRDVAILLTGMGRDGANGLLELKRAGWHTIAQDQASSVMYGMPKAAAEIDAAVEILPPEKIREAILRLAKKRKNGS